MTVRRSGVSISSAEQLFHPPSADSAGSTWTGTSSSSARSCLIGAAGSTLMLLVSSSSACACVSNGRYAAVAASGRFQIESHENGQA